MDFSFIGFFRCPPHRCRARLRILAAGFASQRRYERRNRDLRRKVLIPVQRTAALHSWI
jgi:hypothetical protein